MLLIARVPATKMQNLICLLYEVNNKGYWGMAIQQVLESGNVRKLTQLVNELREQANEDKNVMISIIGEECYEALMAL